MEKQKYEFIQRIESHYVGEDCIQIMIPHYLNNGITVLNSEGMTYHYKPNSNLFINKYIYDERKTQFPYSQIPNHKTRVGFKKIEYINQLLEFNRVYITIENGIITEYFVIKDKDEALLAKKYLLPKEREPKFMNRNEVIELLKSANSGLFSKDAGCYQNYNILTEKQILEWYKEQIIKIRNKEEYCSTNNTISKDITNFINKSLNKLTIDDLPNDIIIADDIFMISTNKTEIDSIKSIIIKFMGNNQYKIESYDFPITAYTLEYMLKLEQTNSRKTQEPKFPRSLNKTISKEEIKKAKQLVLEKKKLPKK